MFVENTAERAAERRVEIPTPVLARAFDGLFHRALGADRDLLEALREGGYDSDRPAPAYSSHVWRSCLEIARRHLFSELPPDEGFRALGRLYADGFAETPVGQAHKGIAYSICTSVAKLPDMIRLGRLDLDVQLRFETDHRCLISVRGRDANGPFTAGVIETRVRKRSLSSEFQVLVVGADPYGFDLLVRW